MPKATPQHLDEPTSGLMTEIDKKLKKNLNTTREGNNITIQGLKNEKSSEDKRAEQYRKEAKTNGTDAPPPKDVLQDLADQKYREQADKAPTTKTTMGMAKGGTASSRADGIAQRGKTKGTIVMCGGGMYK